MYFEVYVSLSFPFVHKKCVKMAVMVVVRGGGEYL